MYGRNMNAYRKTGLKAEMSVAEPYMITKMMYQGLFERLAQAKGAIERGDLPVKAAKLASASAILENLKGSIDFSLNKTLAQNLYDLYSYMIDRIADASIEVSCAPIDLALKVLMPIKNAWDQIPMAARQEAAQQRSAEQMSDFSHKDSMSYGIA